MPEAIVVSTEVVCKGPLFDGRAPREIKAFTDQARHDVAFKAQDQLRMFYTGVFKHPTGYFAGHTQINRPDFSTDRVEPVGFAVVYGPWLEGVGSRNATSRFKGYRMFRTVRAKLIAQVPTLIKSSVDRMIARLND